MGRPVAQLARVVVQRDKSSPGWATGQPVVQWDVPLRNRHPVMQRDKLSIGTEHIQAERVAKAIVKTPELPDIRKFTAP